MSQEREQKDLTEPIHDCFYGNNGDLVLWPGCVFFQFIQS